LVSWHWSQNSAGVGLSSIPKRGNAFVLPVALKKGKKRYEKMTQISFVFLI
jgi:hypothetical protein